jgi:hypothetical protein
VTGSKSVENSLLVGEFGAGSAVRGACSLGLPVGGVPGDGGEGEGVLADDGVEPVFGYLFPGATRLP